jgi:hypothetical protein
LAEHDEEHRRADGCACVASGKALGTDVRGQKEILTERRQSQRWQKGLRGESPCPALGGECGPASPYGDGIVCIRAERRVSDMVIMSRRMARARDGCSQPKHDNEGPAEAYPISTSA